MASKPDPHQYLFPFAGLEWANGFRFSSYWKNAETQAAWDALECEGLKRRRASGGDPSAGARKRKKSKKRGVTPCKRPSS